MFIKVLHPVFAGWPLQIVETAATLGNRSPLGLIIDPKVFARTLLHLRVSSGFSDFPRTCDRKEFDSMNLVFADNTGTVSEV